MTVPTVKHLSQAEIRRRTVDFAYRWHHETQERGEAQSFWNELMQCFGVDRRVAGAKFDRAAKRASTGRVGFIDVFWPTVFLAEHKSCLLYTSTVRAGESVAASRSVIWMLAKSEVIK